jgi:hypothetical protein
VLSATLACVELPTLTASGPPAGHLIKADELRLGWTLLSNIETLDGMRIITAGNEITPLMLHKIRNFASLSGPKKPIQVAL